MAGSQKVLQAGKQAEFIIPSYRTLQEAIAEGTAPDPSKIKDFLGGNPHGWLAAFKAMRADPGDFHTRALAKEDFQWDFDDCCSWSRAFRVLRPIEDVALARSQLSALEEAG